MLRVACMSLMNVIPVVTTVFGAAYAVQPGYGVAMPQEVYLWIPVLGNCLAVLVIPFVGRWSDRIGRRPPIVAGALASGLLSFTYLYAISIGHVPLAVLVSLVMWGVLYQGYNAVFPSFYPELFPARTRVTAMAIAQNRRYDGDGTAARALRRPCAAGLGARPGDGRRHHFSRDRHRSNRRLERARDVSHPAWAISEIRSPCSADEH